MRVLVLGAGGFIGTNLVEYLVTRGHWVRGVGRRAPSHPSQAHEYVIGDLCDSKFVEQVFSGDVFDEVYQLAADMGGISYIKGNRDADIMGTSMQINLNVARASVAHKIKKLFFSSSACVYYTRECRESEAYPAMPDNEYGWEKLFAERLYTNFRRQYGLDVRIARFHSVVGEFAAYEGGKEKAHSALARKVCLVSDGGSIEVFGDGTQTRTFLHVSDCLTGIRALMDSDTHEPVNIGSDELVTINQYIQILKKVSNKNFSLTHIEAPVGVLERGCDLSKARELLKWSPQVTLEDSTARTYEWINNKIKN